MRGRFKKQYRDHMFLFEPKYGQWIASKNSGEIIARAEKEMLFVRDQAKSRRFIDGSTAAEWDYWWSVLRYYNR